MYVVKTSKQLVFNYNSFFRCSTTISVSASMASVFVFDLWPATMLILDLETYLQTAEEKFKKKTEQLMNAKLALPNKISMHTNLVLHNKLLI